MASKIAQVARQVVFQVVLWAVTAWLLYPLIVLDSVTFTSCALPGVSTV